MTSDRARELLEAFINSSHDYDDLIRLPIYDQLVYSEVTDGQITDWTFRALLKIAYDL